MSQNIATFVILEESPRRKEFSAFCVAMFEKFYHAFFYICKQEKNMVNK